MPITFSVKVKIWLEKDNEIIFGPGRIALLESLENTKSLTEAAKTCHISFIKAWKMLNDLNAKLEQPIIISNRGGKGGGGQTVLTEFGQKIVKQYKIIQTKLLEVASSSLISL